MIVDTNAYLGYFAFRQLRHNTAPELLRVMDEKGIDKAMVSSASAITYRNVQPANEELSAAVKPHRDRLIPFAVINPFYAGWRDDLTTCHERFGMKGLRLYPKWHNYALSDRCLLDLIHEATERSMVVSIPRRRKVSAISMPIYPPPMITAVLGLCSARNWWTARPDSRDRKPNTPSSPQPGSGGHSARAPVAMTNLS